ncbi:MAG: hypothetical protein ACK5MZ_08425, partial [Aestuariibaculum sp.]
WLKVQDIIRLIDISLEFFNFVETQYLFTKLRASLNLYQLFFYISFVHNFVKISSSSPAIIFYFASLGSKNKLYKKSIIQI